MKRKKNATSLVELKASWRLKCVLASIEYALLLTNFFAAAVLKRNEKKMYMNARGL